MSAPRATGADDPALAETSWPMPSLHHTEVAHRLVWGSADEDDMRYAASVMSAYRALVCDGTTERQQVRLAALRRIYKARR